MSATPQQLRQWSDELAADPGAPAFLELARHYQAVGRADAALRLVVRGLERNPNHVEGHFLLGVLYREAGDAVKAFDEWDIALALAPEHHGARREIALLCLERGDTAAAERHLEKALENDFTDAEVRAQLERLHAARRAAPPPARAPASAPAPAAPAPAAPAAPAADSGEGFAALQAELAALGAERGMLGAVVMDAQGYVLAGAMQVQGADRGPEVAAVLFPARAEAERAVRHLGLGEWKGILVETPEAVIRLAPTPDQGMVAVAGGSGVPMGWVLRLAGRARAAAARFLGGGAEAAP